ncbi:MAG: NUDIX hydrolase [Anaerolinea sp.]|nr:NUDIX hydrolase [Anaerolinea sp.]
MREIVIHREEIYSGRIVHLSAVDVRLPNGKEAHRELIQHPGAVAIVALDEEQNVVLVSQYRLAADRIMWEIPAGTLNPGEAPLVCAERELQEEAGLFPGKLDALGGLYVAPGYTTEFIHLFIATELSESRLEMDEDEFIESKRVPFAEALDMIERGDIIDGKSIAGLFKTARRLGL